MKIVIAPHPDDEIWALEHLKSGVDVVIYVEEVLGGRDLEAIRCAQNFKFRPVFCHGLEGLKTYLTFLTGENTIIYPTDDIHPLHKLVKELIQEWHGMQNFNLIEYKVDNLVNVEQIKIIKEIYKSQSWLLECKSVKVRV